MTVTAILPGTSSSRKITVIYHNKQVVVLVPGRYFLAVPLTVSVDWDSMTTKFDNMTETLRIVMPVKVGTMMYLSRC